MGKVKQPGPKVRNTLSLYRLFLSRVTGAGARRLEVTEEHEIFSATMVYFRAGKTRMSTARRTASVGPGLAFDHDEIEEEAVSNEEHDHPVPLPGSSTNTWQRDSRRRVSMDYHFFHHNSFNDIPTPPYSPPNTRPSSIRADDSIHSIPMMMPHLTHRTDSWASNGSSNSRHVEQPGTAYDFLSIIAHSNLPSYLRSYSHLSRSLRTSLLSFIVRGTSLIATTIS